MVMAPWFLRLQTVFSKRCFSDSSPGLATEENPLRTRMPENTSALKHFGAFCRCRSWPHSERTTLKHRLENTVCYSLVIAPSHKFTPWTRSLAPSTSCLAKEHIWRAVLDFVGVHGGGLGPILANSGAPRAFTIRQQVNARCGEWSQRPNTPPHCACTSLFMLFSTNWRQPPLPIKRFIWHKRGGSHAMPCFCVRMPYFL